MTFPITGTISNETNSQYHLRDGHYSSSQLIDWEIYGSQFFCNAYVAPLPLVHPRTETDAMRLGSLVHSMVLEPKLTEREFSVVPSGLRRTNGQAPWEEYKRAHAGLTWIKEKDWDWAHRLAVSTRAEIINQNLFEPESVIAPETSYRWNIGNLQLKVRWDYACYVPNSTTETYLLDIKTMSLPDRSVLALQDLPWILSDAVIDRSYDFQQCLYRRGLAAATGVPEEEIKCFMLFCLHSAQMNYVRTVTCDITGHVNNSERRVDTTIAGIQDCIASGDWSDNMGVIIL